MRAFVLIEILFSTFILILIAGAIYVIISIAMVSWDSNRGKLEVMQELRQAMDGMTRESRQGKLSSMDSTDGSRLNFSIPDINFNISYYVQNNQLIREHPPGTMQVLANNVNYLNFNLTSAELQIHIQANKNIKNASHAFSLTEGVRLRNE